MIKLDEQEMEEAIDRAIEKFWDDYIDFYIKDDPEKHMIVMKGDNVTIVDHLNKED